MAIPHRGRGRGRPQREQDRTPMNERIRSREVRVVDDDGGQLGIMATADAIDIARKKGLDLVEVASSANPPVARIMDYGKFKYEVKKKQQEAKKKQTIIHVKEIKMRPGTDQHDFDFKIKHAQRFLEEGDKVKILITFRGREIMHKRIGAATMERVVSTLESDGVVESPPKMEGRAMVAIMAPKAQATKGKGIKPSTEAKAKAKAKAKAEAEAEAKPEGEAKPEASDKAPESKVPEAASPTESSAPES